MIKKPTGSKKTKAKAKPKIPEVLTAEVLPPNGNENNEVDETNEINDFEQDTDLELMGDLQGDSEHQPNDEKSSDHLSHPVPLEETRFLTAHDPLKQYLEELRKYPLLEPHEEFALVRKMQESSDPTEARAAARALVTANLRLVVKIAFEYRTFYSNLLDLIQEGNVGLMKAVSKFDPSKGARLGYYASWWIRSYILKYLLENFRLVKVGTTQAQKKLFYHLMREKERLENQGLLAGPRLLAEKLNVREKDVVEMEHRLSGHGAEMSLDAPIDHEDGSKTLHLDLLTTDNEGADESLARNQLLHILHEKLPEFTKLLNEKEQKILNDRLLADEPKTLQEVADLYGLTRERARQIEAKVIEKLREFLGQSFSL